MKYKVVFVSNFMNSHQLFLSNCFHDIFGSDYTFIETDRLSEERKLMKFDSLYEKSSSAIISTFNNKSNEIKALTLINDSDFVIYGSAPIRFILSRLKDKKPIFYYTERVFRNGTWRIINPKFLFYLWMNYFRYFNKNLYLLSVGKYTYSDFKLLGLFMNKSYKWGYFPETKKYNIQDLLSLKESQSQINILWVGRLINWKHPEHCIRIAKFLKSRNINFRLKIIGEGPMYSSLLRLKKVNGLDKHIEFSGFLNSISIYEEMEKTHIYLMTSDQNEGWGVVVNEALNCACAVVGSNLVGSISYLIENNKNGLVYKFSSTRDLNLKVLKLINDRRFRTEISINGFSKITKEWNPEIASKNLFNIFDSIAKSGKNLNNNKGPGEKI
jgi:glycosyltransferase involved in cell wall biosynthesis